MSTMVEILERVIATRGGRRQSGLCVELVKAGDLDADHIHALFKTWEHFSGNSAFPVPDPDRPGDPDAAEDIYCREGDPGYWVGPYGELRLKLAEHLLRALQPYSKG